MLLPKVHSEWNHAVVTVWHVTEENTTCVWDTIRIWRYDRYVYCRLPRLLPAGPLWMDQEPTETSAKPVEQPRRQKAGILLPQSSQMVSGRGDILVTRLKFFFSRNVIFRLKINIRPWKTARGVYSSSWAIADRQALEEQGGTSSQRGSDPQPLSPLWLQGSWVGIGFSLQPWIPGTRRISLSLAAAPLPAEPSVTLWQLCRGQQLRARAQEPAKPLLLAYSL